jgi:DNA-binding beta-propeller fold protein YncE
MIYRDYSPKTVLTEGRDGPAKLPISYPVSVFEQKDHLLVAGNSLYSLDLTTKKAPKIVLEFGACIPELKDVTVFGAMAMQPHTGNLLLCESIRSQIRVIADPFSLSPTQTSAIGRPSEIGDDREGYFHGPEGVCCAPDGGIVVADTGNSRVQFLDPAGRYKSQLPDLEFTHPADVCFSLHSVLCVADPGARRLSMWSRDGQEHIYDLPMSYYNTTLSPMAVCLDLNGYLHVAFAGRNHFVRIYDLRHSIGWLQKLGSASGASGGKIGEFNRPTGMCVDGSNNLIVCDTDNCRLQIFPPNNS